MTMTIRMMLGLALLAGSTMALAGPAAAEGDVKTGAEVTVDTGRDVTPKPYLFNPPPERPSNVDRQRAAHRELELKNAITDHERGSSSQDERSIIQLRGERERMERVHRGRSSPRPPAQSIRTTRP
jgi:hypothetical protein